VITANRIGSTRVAAALRDVPRHLFLPGLPPESAYRDDAIVTKRDADGQPTSSSSQPAIMAIMLDQLDLAPGQRVLEIGAGTGYNAALMSHIVGSGGTVVSVDIDSEVAAQAREHLASAGYPDVTVVAADGAAGYRPSAPYDRVIATVGVSDLAPPWLDQLSARGRIVVPLDIRGTQLAVAFEPAGDPDPVGLRDTASGHWRSVSLTPCGFMRMRGPLAGPERTVLLPPGLSLMLPDGLMLTDGKEVDAEAVAGYLGGPPVELATGVSAGSVQVVWGLGLWLAAGDPRACTLGEERPAGARGRRVSGPASSRLARAPVRTPGMLATAGIVDSGGIAVLTATPSSSRGTGAGGDGGAKGARGARGVGTASGLLALAVAGFGPHASELAARLAAHVQAWDQAGQPGTAGLHVDAYPRSSAAEPGDLGDLGPVRGGLLIERPSTRFVVYHT
jgi:protein-L-isoaspartate(D-aspartate) O-methyltransferase